MHDSDMAFEEILRQDRQRLDDRLHRMARYNLFPQNGKHGFRNLGTISIVLMSIRNVFTR